MPISLYGGYRKFHFVVKGGKKFIGGLILSFFVYGGWGRAIWPFFV